MSRSTTTSW